MPCRLEDTEVSLRGGLHRVRVVLPRLRQAGDREGSDSGDTRGGTPKATHEGRFPVGRDRGYRLHGEKLKGGFFRFVLLTLMNSTQGVADALETGVPERESVTGVTDGTTTSPLRDGQNAERIGETWVTYGSDGKFADNSIAISSGANYAAYI